LDKRDKFALNKRIICSVHKYKRRKRIQKITITSTMVLLMCIGFKILFFNNQAVKVVGPSITQHSNSLQVDLSSESDVKLVLSKDKEVLINEQNSEIRYSNTGEIVSINKDRSVKQNSRNKNNSIFNTIIVPYGKQSKITLSDGSEVWLNSGTKFTYPIALGKEKREVYLEGEAIFKVTHNEQSPFYVITLDYEVKVLGTVFNVSSYPDDAYTTTALESGSVEISLLSNVSSENKSVKITPGTLATFSKQENDIITEKVNVSRYMSWREGVFIFENDNLNYILKKVSRHYKVPIIIENENQEENTYSGNLDITTDLEQVLNILKKTAEFKYDIVENKVKISLTK
jgi:transmembrane sensor